METIDDYWAQYCSSIRHTGLFIVFLQEREAFGLSVSVWQLIHNQYSRYCANTFDCPSFYLWLKSENLILN